MQEKVINEVGSIQNKYIKSKLRSRLKLMASQCLGGREALSEVSPQLMGHFSIQWLGN